MICGCFHLSETDIIYSLRKNISTFVCDRKWKNKYLPDRREDIC